MAPKSEQQRPLLACSSVQEYASVPESWSAPVCSSAESAYWSGSACWWVAPAYSSATACLSEDRGIVGGTGLFVGGTAVFVGTGVLVGGTGVIVGGTGVLVGGTGVAVGGTGVFSVEQECWLVQGYSSEGTGVSVGGTGVSVGGTGVLVGTGVSVGWGCLSASGCSSGAPVYLWDVECSLAPPWERGLQLELQQQGKPPLGQVSLFLTVWQTEPSSRSLLRQSARLLQSESPLPPGWQGVLRPSPDQTRVWPLLSQRQVLRPKDLPRVTRLPASSSRRWSFGRLRGLCSRRSSSGS